MMWIADGWSDFEIIDCGQGEKLERWGNYILARPDPQAIWEKALPEKRWQSANASYRRSSAGGGAWNVRRLPERWNIRYPSLDLTFHIKPMNFKHTGLFQEQAANWEFIYRSIQAAGRPVSVLNLFAYTGGATVAAARAGASVCHVDASRGMVSWAKENAQASGLASAPIRWIVDDCKKFLERELRRGRTYDAVIMDPPSYGRGPNGEIWKIETGIAEFIRLAARVLSARPLFLLINSYSTGLAPSVMGYMASSLLHPTYHGTVHCAELGLPVSSTGLALPCGNSTRYLF